MNFAVIVGYLSMAGAGILAMVHMGKVAASALDYFYKKRRSTEINQQFVQDVAMNHLPHIYNALKLIAHSKGIDLPEPPSIRWQQINGRHRG